jgi:hypothetical protein
VVTETLEKRRAEVARILGENKVELAEPRWLNMMEQGVIVELHIRRWRGKTKLDFGDLGLPKTAEDEIYSHLMKLGEKRLLPQKEISKGNKVSYVDLLDAVDSAARKWLERNSYETHWGRFVPYTMYQQWKQGNERYKEQYAELREEIYSRYDDILAQLQREYEGMALAAYRRIKALNGSIRQAESIFVQRFVNHVLSLVPGREAIRASFGYEEEVYYIPLPSQLQQDLAKAKRIIRRSQLQEQAEIAKISALRTMNYEVVNQAKSKKQEMIDSFLSDVARQIRSLIYDVTTNVMESIKKNGKLVGKSSVQLSNLIESVKGLDFYGDREVEAMITRVGSIVGTDVKDRNLDEITDRLKDIGVLTRASLLALGETPRSGRQIGIPSVPANGMVRKARRSLGLDAELQPELVRTGRRG